MLGRSNDAHDSQTSGVLIQYLREINAYLQEIHISRKTMTLAVAMFVLAGLLGVRYREEGTILPTSSSAGGREVANLLRADRRTKDCIDIRCGVGK